jgi:hypothetical protein
LVKTFGRKVEVLARGPLLLVLLQETEAEKAAKLAAQKEARREWNQTRDELNQEALAEKVRMLNHKPALNDIVIHRDPLGIGRK